MARVETRTKILGVPTRLRREEGVKARAHVRQRGLEECAARSVGSSALAEGHEACRVDETAHPSQRGELEALE